MSSSTWRVLSGYATYQRTPMSMISCGKWAPLKLTAIVALPLACHHESEGEIIPQITSNENLRQSRSCCSSNTRIEYSRSITVKHLQVGHLCVGHPTGQAGAEQSHDT